MPDRSKENTQTKRDTLVLQVEGWVDGPAPHHPEKDTHAKKNLDRGSEKQNQLTWYGHVLRMAEGRLPKIALQWMPKQK